ncbi:MAG TPA: sulfite exporter TauE/SafE family protein [Actinocrinis sp.]|nr:sulfite exporter TauE/SafE family protein [Actinocrinis sp.]
MSISAHDLIEAVSILGAGLAAGTINTVVGSGTLITFPTLLAFGYSPLVANVSNTVGLVPGVMSGIAGMRRELDGQKSRLLFLGSGSLLGGILGAILLLSLPSDAFKAIVPVLIGLALVLVVVQPRLSARVAARRDAPVPGTAAVPAPGPAESEGVDAAAESEPGTVATAARPKPQVSRGGLVLWALVFGTGVYGGYFGAAQGVLLLAFLGISFTDPMKQLNGTKNVLAALVNGVAAVIFIVLSPVNWTVVALVAAGSIIGGQVGARIGRRLPPTALRVLIVCVGVAALVKLLV